MNPFWLSEDELAKVSEIIRTGSLVQGENVEEFEREFREYVGARYAIAVNSGTAALHLALQSSGISAGDEVITSPLSFVSTANAALFLGAIPEFSDVNRSTGNLEPNEVKKIISRNVKAIIGVHLYGLPFDAKELREISNENGATLIEDAAQAIGAEYGGLKVGRLGGVACFSFFATKNLAIGEGGMITTDNEEVASRCRILRSHGARSKYLHEQLGYNYRMTEVSAAIGRIQLPKIEKMNDKRVKNANALHDILSNTPNLSLPPHPRDRKHVFYRYAPRINKVISEKRSTIIDTLQSGGWDVTPGYPMPIYAQPLYRQLSQLHWLRNTVKWPDYQMTRCKNCEVLTRTIIELPVDPHLPEEAVVRLGEALKHAVREVS